MNNILTAKTVKPQHQNTVNSHESLYRKLCFSARLDDSYKSNKHRFLIKLEPTMILKVHTFFYKNHIFFSEARRFLENPKIEPQIILK